MVRRARPILCGQAPGKGGQHLPPLTTGMTVMRLLALTGLPFDAYASAFDRVNVLDYWPGYVGRKGDAFPVRQARYAARAMAMDWDGRVVVMLGKNVADAFALGDDVEWFIWERMRIEVPVEVEFEYAVIPHASPVNKFWNDSENIARGRNFFDALLQGRDRGSRRKA